MCEIEHVRAGVVAERGGFGGFVEHEAESAIDAGGQSCEVGAEGDFPAASRRKQIKNFADEVQCGGAWGEDHVERLRLLKELFGDIAGPAMVASVLMPRR